MDNNLKELEIRHIVRELDKASVDELKSIMEVCERRIKQKQKKIIIVSKVTLTVITGDNGNPIEFDSQSQAEDYIINTNNCDNWVIVKV